MTTIYVAGNLYLTLPDGISDRLDSIESDIATTMEGVSGMAKTLKEVSDKADALQDVVNNVATAVAPFPQLVNDFEALRTQLQGNLSPENQALVDAMSDKLDAMGTQLAGVASTADAAVADAADGTDEAAGTPTP